MCYYSPCIGMRRRFVLALAVFIFQTLLSTGEPKTLHRPFNNTIPAIFVFGDSTVDPGNNNYVTTIFKSNFPPYGIDFPDHAPTGRFTDGRLVTDFIASYIGIKEYVPPYLNPDLKHDELMTGVSFASAGSGFDKFTSDTLHVISMKQQMEKFRECKTKLAAKFGKEKAADLVKKAIYIVSAGTNDIILSYYTMGFRNSSMDMSAYANSLVGNAKQFLQELKKEGAQNLAVVGVSKIGCVPLIVTGNNLIGRPGCDDSLSAVAAEFNKKLLNVVEAMKSPNFRFVYADLYKTLGSIIENPRNFGFSNAESGCCGTGGLEVTFLCNPTTHVCINPSQYVFFDSVHPSEASYKQIFKLLRSTIDEAIKKFSQ